jgi:uncharacterized protein
MAPKDELVDFIGQLSFPCIMAKTVAHKGLLQVETVSDFNASSAKSVLTEIYGFIDSYRQKQQRLSSFAVILHSELSSPFDSFEQNFWAFLSQLNHYDKEKYPHDDRVSSDYLDDAFSFSLKAEAFFILALHPQSPRWSRRFKYPAIIFNPHAQFERLRRVGIFTKVRNIIRKRDMLLQGSINPMLNDFGEKSEVYQYLGRTYTPQDIIPLKYEVP